MKDSSRLPETEQGSKQSISGTDMSGPTAFSPNQPNSCIFISSLMMGANNDAVVAELVSSTHDTVHSDFLVHRIGCGTELMLFASSPVSSVSALQIGKLNMNISSRVARVCIKVRQRAYLAHICSASAP
jgi:hypothetical protein